MCGLEVARLCQPDQFDSTVYFINSSCSAIVFIILVLNRVAYPIKIRGKSGFQNGLQKLFFISDNHKNLKSIIPIPVLCSLIYFGLFLGWSLCIQEQTFLIQIHYKVLSKVQKGCKYLLFLGHQHLRELLEKNSLCFIHWSTAVELSFGVKL